MAKKEETPKTVLERNYVIPLRQETLKVAPYRKAEKAMRAVKEFVSKHMKSSDVKIGKYLNLKIWEHGMKNPPHKVKVTAAKDDEGGVFVELQGTPKEEIKVEEKKKEIKKEETAEAKEKPEEKIEKKIEEIKEEKAEEAKKIEQEEIKELKKEQHIPKHHAPKAPPKSKFQEAHPSAPKSV